MRTTMRHVGVGTVMWRSSWPLWGVWRSFLVHRYSEVIAQSDKLGSLIANATEPMLNITYNLGNFSGNLSAFDSTCKLAPFLRGQVRACSG